MTGHNASASTDGGGVGGRRSLLVAVAVLMMLMLILSSTARPFGLKPAALIGLPVALIAATSLILVLLVLTGSRPRDRALAEAARAVDLAFVPAVAVDATTMGVVAANAAGHELMRECHLELGCHFSELLADESPPECRRVVLSASEAGHASAEGCMLRVPRRSLTRARIEARALTVEEEQLIVVAFIPEESGDEAIVEFARVQERLMSNISHELRTPLNVVMGFAELMTTGTLGEMAPKQLDAAHEIYTGGQRILTMINDVLDIGRARSYYQPGEASTVDPAEILHRVEALLTGQARRAEVSLELDIPDDLPPVEVPERPFKQTLYHLLLDRIDASQPGDEVRVTVEATDRVRLIVTDAGTPPDARDLEPRPMPALGEEEARSANAPPAVGLPLCAALVGTYGASLTLKTDEDGQHFTLELPEAELIG